MKLSLFEKLLCRILSQGEMIPIDDAMQSEETTGLQWYKPYPRMAAMIEDPKGLLRALACAS